MIKYIIFLILTSTTVLYSLQPMLYNMEEWISLTSESNTNNHSIPLVSDTWKHTDTEIFVGIAVYRDRRCGLTLKNLILKANNPQRLYFGIVEAKHTEEDKMDCISDYCELMNKAGRPGCPYDNHIRYIEHSWLDSRGPGHSRSMLNGLLEDEEFCMQIDSHTDVVQDWDKKLMNMWGSIDNEYAILSTRLPDVSSLPTSNNQDNNHEVPHLCQATYTSSGMLRALQPRVVRNLDHPMLAPLWAAGFSFSKCHAQRKVPYDPLLPFIFDGEEFTRFARYWTRGYDVYTPNEIVLVHDYIGKMEKQLPEKMGIPRKENGQTYEIDNTEWVHNGMNAEYRRRIFDDALQRASMLLKGPDINSIDAKVYADMLITLSKYGLGMKRTIDQFIEFTGVDVRSNRVYSDRCKCLEWVPFVPDKDPYTEDDDVWGGAPEILYQGARDIPILRADISILPFTKLEQQDILQNNLRSSSRQLPEDESWWGFNMLDLFIHYLIDSVDKKFGLGRGQQVLKVVLLAAPVFVGVLAGAIWVIKGDDRSATSYTKNI